MKPRVINGKRYNTQAANLVGKKNGLSLYRKTTGEYFATKDGEYVLLRNDPTQLEDIAKTVLSDREYVYEFSIRDTELINASLELPKPIYEKVIELSEKNNSNLKETIRELLFDSLF